jgi:putative membrane protein
VHRSPPLDQKKAFQRALDRPEQGRIDPAMQAERKLSPPLRAFIALAIGAALFALLVWWQPSGLYPWLKAFHIVAVIAWMAGMLYLPRLFVYHCVAEPGSKQSETFKVMERRLLTVIINPAMVATWALGLWLAWDASLFTAGWLQLKLALVLAMSAVHGFLSGCVRTFAEDRNRRSQRFYRILNEAPTVLLIGIVILAVVKPF